MVKPGEKKLPATLRRREPDPVFGLQANMLPLTREVGQALVHEAEESRYQREAKELRQEDYDEATFVVSRQLEELYKKASIPTVESRGRGNIKRKVKRLWELRKSECQKKTNPSFKGVSRTRSKNGQVKVCWSNIKYKLFEVANKDKNVPNHEKAFFQDQWTRRKMELGKK